MLPISAVQTAIYEALSDALPVRVLDRAGPNEPFPYVTIGEFTGTSADSLIEQGVDLECTVHVWSRQKGTRETQELMEAAKDTLDRRRFQMIGFANDFQWVATAWTYAQTLRDPDGITTHGVLRFTVMTYQPPAAAATAVEFEQIKGE
jgi:Protein of unknown function (DUF3168)